MQIGIYIFNFNQLELEKDLDGLDDRRRKRREMPSTSHSSLLQALQSHTGSTDQQMQQSSEETYSTHDESQALQSNGKF